MPQVNSFPRCALVECSVQSAPRKAVDSVPRGLSCANFKQLAKLEEDLSYSLIVCRDKMITIKYCLLAACVYMHGQIKIWTLFEWIFTFH